MVRWKDIKYYYLILKRKVKDFLLGTKGREFLIFLFFFLIASAFWLLQTLKNDYQTEFTIPIRLRDVPNDIVITSDIPKEIRITVRDRGTVLLNYMLGQSFYPINLDFNDYANRGTNVRILSRELDRKIDGQLNASTTLLSVKPDTLDFIYTEGIAKRLPVALRGNISAGRQYYITDTIFTPDSVTVYAPSEILDTMNYAYTVSLNLPNLTDTTRQNALLFRYKGVKYVPPTVEVTFPVDIITEKTLEIPITPLNFPGDRILRTFPSKVAVTFQVGLNRFKTINPEDFVLTVSYYDLIRNTSDKYPLRLQSIPDGVSHVRIIPEEIDYLIEQVSDAN